MTQNLSSPGVGLLEPFVLEGSLWCVGLLAAVLLPSKIWALFVVTVMAILALVVIVGLVTTGARCVYQPVKLFSFFHRSRDVVSEQLTGDRYTVTAQTFQVFGQIGMNTKLSLPSRRHLATCVKIIASLFWALI